MKMDTSQVPPVAKKWKKLSEWAHKLIVDEHITRDYKYIEHYAPYIIT